MGSFSPFRSPFSPSRGAQRAFAERWIGLFCRLPGHSLSNGSSVGRLCTRQRAMSAQKGRFHRPFSENCAENALCPLCCVSLSCVHAPVIGVCRRQSAAPRVSSPLRSLQVEVQTALLGAQCRPLLSLRTPFPFAPLRSRACGAFRLSYFPLLSCPNFFSPACYSVRPWWFPPLCAPPNLNPSAHRACSSPIATPVSPFRAPWYAAAINCGVRTTPVCSSSTKMPSTATVSP